MIVLLRLKRQLIRRSAIALLKKAAENIMKKKYTQPCVYICVIVSDARIFLGKQLIILEQENETGMTNTYCTSQLKAYISLLRYTFCILQLKLKFL